MSETQSQYLDRALAYLKEIGERPMETPPPKKAMVYFESAGLGNFVLQNVVAAALLRRFPRIYVAAAYRDAPNWRGFLTDCNPWVHSEMRAEAGSPMVMPLDWFDVGVNAPVKCPDPMWEERRMNWIDLLLVPSMLEVDASRLAGLAEAPPCLRLPPSQEAQIHALMGRIGLTPDRWFACLHVRTGPADDPRSVSLDSYLPVIEHIVRDQGGQVVRLGLPEDPPLPALEGVIDLSRSDGSFILQAAAASLARYMIGTDAGPVTLAAAFGTPCAVTNALSFSRRVWKRDDLVLAKTMVLPDGELLSTRAAFERGCLDRPPPSGTRFEDNDPETLLAVARRLFEATADCPGWRPKAEEPEVMEEQSLTLPYPMREAPLVSFWD